MRGNRSDIRRYGGVLATVLICLGFGGCAGADKVGKPVSLSSYGARANAEREAAVQVQINGGATRGYLNDGDGDSFGAQEDRSYHDSDDNSLSFSGEARAASASEARTVTMVVRRYIALAAAGDGARGCSMLQPSLAVAMPLDYGKFGAPYLRGATTCQAVVARMFNHSRSQWSAPVAVTGVVVMSAEHTAVMVGSVKMPASYFILQRENGGWKMTIPLPRPME
jgi:hypothetical protein